MNPDIYVMDEPSANLDMEVTERLKKIVALLKSQGKTIIIAEHRIAYLRWFGWSDCLYEKWLDLFKTI